MLAALGLAVIAANAAEPMVGEMMMDANVPTVARVRASTPLLSSVPGD